MCALWGTKQVAHYLGVPVQTLYQWRMRGYGPPGSKIGKHLRYESAEVVAWFKSQRRNDSNRVKEP